MAKATARCSCSKCGNAFMKTAIKANRTAADAWENWAVANYDLCPKCWGAEQKEAEKEKGLVLEIELNNNPFEVAEKEKPIRLSFVGDTYPYKDNIKAIGGYTWSDKTGTGLLGSLSASYPKAWIKYIEPTNLTQEIKKAESIGAKIENKINKSDIAMHGMIFNQTEHDK